MTSVTSILYNFCYLMKILTSHHILFPALQKKWNPAHIKNMNIYIYIYIRKGNCNIKKKKETHALACEGTQLGHSFSYQHQVNWNIGSQTMPFGSK